MTLQEEIRKNLTFGSRDMREAAGLSCLPPDCPAWTFIGNGQLAVAIPAARDLEFHEEFSAITVKTVDLRIRNERGRYLILECGEEIPLDQFVMVACDFVSPGENGARRAEIARNPAEWWRSWKETLGNVSREMEPYSVLGELTTLEYCAKQGMQPRWTGAQSHTHDIETALGTYEVKSTLSRYGFNVVISSVYQLDAGGNRPLYLSFLRFEESKSGRSINDLVRSLVHLGLSEAELEKSLQKLHLERGRTGRRKRYVLRDWILYPVDESFPAVTRKSFKNDRLPRSVVGITYTVDLSGVRGIRLMDDRPRESINGQHN